jgi:hypothetical protein
LVWFSETTGNYVVDNRRTKTNRRVMLCERYTATDFDFALVYISDLDLFYLFPMEEFISYGSEIHLVEADKRQRRPRSADVRDAWELMVWEEVGRTTAIGQQTAAQFDDRGFPARIDIIPPDRLHAPLPPDARSRE